MIDNITLYKYFLETASCGSFSAAARRLYVSQPAVSGEIMQLEGQLGVKLFFRTSRGIKLTPEGELLLEYVKSAFSFLEAGEDKLRDISGLRCGVMRVGASDMTLKFYLLRYLERFNNEYPRVRLTVTNAPTPQTLRALKNGAIDFCVVSEPVEPDEDVEFVPVRTIRDIMVATEKFPPAVADEVDFDELDGLPHIMLERGTSTRRYVEDYLRASGAPASLLEPDIELATSDLVLEFALRGIGIACIMEDFARAELDSGRLRELKLKRPFPPRRFLLAYLKKTPPGAATREFISSLTEE